jgi:hypothetical protein
MRPLLSHGASVSCRGQDTPASDEEQAQILAATASAGNAQALAPEEPARRQGRVDEIALAAPALPAVWALALVDGDTGSLQEADEARPVAACPLDRERRHAELPRPEEQAAITSRCRGDLAAVELGAERVEGNRDVDLLVGVSTPIATVHSMT